MDESCRRSSTDSDNIESDARESNELKVETNTNILTVLRQVLVLI